MVSVADFGFCFSHRWLVSPESQLHGFPLITPYSADLFTIVSIGPMSTTCILFHWLPHEFVIHAYCTSPSFWHLWRFMRFLPSISSHILPQL